MKPVLALVLIISAALATACTKSDHENKSVVTTKNTYEKSQVINGVKSHAKLVVSDVYVRETLGQNRSTAAYMRIDNKGDATARLISVSIGDLGAGGLHEMKMTGNLMEMKAMEHGLELPKGTSVVLAPGGNHVMLTDLKTPLKSGDTLKLTLNFDNGASLAIDAPIKALNEEAHDEKGHADH